MTIPFYFAAMLWIWSSVCSAAATWADNPDFERIGERLANEQELIKVADYPTSAYSRTLDEAPLVDRKIESAGPSTFKLFSITAQASNLFGAREPTSMTIDIIPGSSENIVRSSAGRVIPVAILGSGGLNVTAINPRTIRLNGVDVMLVGKSDKSLCRQQDINDDGYEDLVCDVRTTGFKVGEGEFTVILKAATYNGESLKGGGRIRILRD